MILWHAAITPLSSQKQKTKGFMHNNAENLQQILGQNLDFIIPVFHLTMHL